VHTHHLNSCSPTPNTHQGERGGGGERRKDRNHGILGIAYGIHLLLIQETKHGVICSQMENHPAK